jgi:hypothetical protein
MTSPMSAVRARPVGTSVARRVRRSRRWRAGLLSLVASGATLVWTSGVSAAAPNATGTAASVKASHQSLCVTRPGLCVDPQPNIGPNGSYVGHDEPSIAFRSSKPGTGMDMTYYLRLPKDPPARPKQDGTGGTWNFQLRPTFWLGLTLCDTESSPEYTRVCQPGTDANAAYTSTNPASPAYIGRHPGNAFMELQFYEPGYVPQFEGFGCTATQWCANLTIDSLSLDQNTGVANNADCLNNHLLVGLEPINWAYLTKSGKSQAPADPLKISDSPDPAKALNPDPAKDLLMNSGDDLIVHIHDTAAGIRTDISDKTTGAHGSMTASIANGFGQVIYAPNAKKCTSRPYAFHPEYSSANTRGNTWSAHTVNVSFSDEIGHFELCNAIDAATGACTQPVRDEPTPDDDDVGCLPAADSLLIRITSCTGSDLDFDGLSYQKRWPGTLPGSSVDRKVHPTPIMFSSPTSRGRQYENVAFETNLPSIEVEGPNACNRTTGAHCTNPPPGAKFYPFYSTTNAGPTKCAWQEGGPFLPGTIDNFGGSSTTAFGKLLRTVYPERGFTTSTLFENFRRDLANPCKGS